MTPSAQVKAIPSSPNGRGALHLTPVTFRAMVRCAGCGAPWIREVESKGAAEALLASQGWHRTGAQGYCCDVCLSGVNRRSVSQAHRAHGQNALVKLLIGGYAWDPVRLQAALGGISRARLYQLRQGLESRGLVNAVTKRLNVQGVEAYARRLTKAERAEVAHA